MKIIETPKSIRQYLEERCQQMNPFSKNMSKNLGEILLAA